MRNNRKSYVITGICLAIVLVLGYLLVINIGSPVGRPLTTLSPRGDKSQAIQNLIVPVFAIAGVVFILVEIGLVFVATRFRRRSDEVDGEGEPVQLHGNTKLELGWTIAPALLLAVLAVFNVNTILQMDDATDPLEVTVIGQQWWWEYRYDLDNDGAPDIITATEAAIPVGRDVRFKIQSNDVIHSFWIPALSGKMDAVPGRTHQVILQANEVGMFQGQCTEYCGLSHGLMRMQVKALTPEDYQVWLTAMTTSPAQPDPKNELAVQGQTLFVAQCSYCHQIDGVTPTSKSPYPYNTVPDPDYGKTVAITMASGNAPNLTHMMMRQHFVGGLLDLYEEGGSVAQAIPEGTPNTNNIKRWLRNPQDVKPMDPNNNQGMPNYNLSEAQIEQLTAYLLTLK